MNKNIQLEEIKDLIGDKRFSLVREVIEEGEIVWWFNQENKGYDGITPYQFCNTCGFGRLDDMIYRLRSGH